MQNELQIEKKEKKEKIKKEKFVINNESKKRKVSIIGTQKQQQKQKQQKQKQKQKQYWVQESEVKFILKQLSQNGIFRGLPSDDIQIFILQYYGSILEDSRFYFILQTSTHHLLQTINKMWITPAGNLIFYATQHLEEDFDFKSTSPRFRSRIYYQMTPQQQQSPLNLLWCYSSSSITILQKCESYRLCNIRAHVFEDNDKQTWHIYRNNKKQCIHSDQKQQIKSTSTIITMTTAITETTTTTTTTTTVIHIDSCFAVPFLFGKNDVTHKPRFQFQLHFPKSHPKAQFCRIAYYFDGNIICQQLSYFEFVKSNFCQLKNGYHKGNISVITHETHCNGLFVAILIGHEIFSSSLTSRDFIPCKVLLWKRQNFATKFQLVASLNIFPFYSNWEFDNDFRCFMHFIHLNSFDSNSNQLLISIFEKKLISECHVHFILLELENYTILSEKIMTICFRQSLPEWSIESMCIGKCHFNRIQVLMLFLLNLRPLLCSLSFTC